MPSNYRKILTQLERSGNLLYANGWFFFVPYLIPYLYGKYSNCKIEPLFNFFVFLHFCNILLFSYYLYRLYEKKRRGDFLFWIALALLFLIPGAYLEFPSDAWEHFRRNFSWQSDTFLLDNPTNFKFTYFWAWTLMSKVEPIFRRFALDVYSSFWQLLLAYQFYLLALKLGFSKSWAKVHVVATVCLLGTNVLGFYRYYALSSTPLSYIAYLRVLIIMINITQGKREQSGLILLLIPIIYYNHAQGLLMIVVSTIALILYSISQRVEAKKLKLFWQALPLVMIVSYILGAWAVQNYQLVTRLIPIQNWLQEPRYLSQWGTLRIWDWKLSTFETLGLHGIFSLILALIFHSKYRLLSFLTITPYFLFLFPPFVFALAAVIGDYDMGYVTFRLLFAFPTSFMLVVGIKETLSYITRNLHYNLSRIQQLLSVTLIIIIISTVPISPYRGRLWFQLYKPSAELSLKTLDVTAQWFLKNRSMDSNCIFISDGVTNFMLATHFAWKNQETRYERFRIGYGTHLDLTSSEAFRKSVQAKNVCGLLVPRPEKVNPIPISLAGKWSGHWPENFVKENLMVNKDLEKAIELYFQEMSWNKTFVPPFYWLYEPSNPESGNG